MKSSPYDVGHCAECANTNMIKKGTVKLFVGNTYFSLCDDHIQELNEITQNSKIESA